MQLVRKIGLGREKCRCRFRTSERPDPGTRAPCQRSGLADLPSLLAQPTSRHWWPCETAGRRRAGRSACTATQCRSRDLCEAGHYFDSTRLPFNPAGLGTSGDGGNRFDENNLTKPAYEKTALPRTTGIENVVPPA
jgi:hypothetical protein